MPNVESIIRNYDLDRLCVATIASHSALQILRACKAYGFKTIAIARDQVAWFYKRFNFIDEVWISEYPELPKLADRLVRENAILIPHGSMVEYVGWKRLMEIPVPIHGVRGLLEVEADQRRKMELLQIAGIPTPKTFDDVENVDRPVIVKLYGAKGGRGYVIARNKEELKEKLRGIKGPYIIQEYVIGVPAYYHYYASAIYDRVEIMGMDIRYESNVDGRTFGLAEPTFVVVGNMPLVIRESLLPTIVRYGEQFAKAVEEVIGERMKGPYSLESIIRDDLTIVVFEFSGRIVAGTNVYMGVGSPYSTLYFDRPIDMGTRIAIELNEARKRGRLLDVVS